MGSICWRLAKMYNNHRCCCLTASYLMCTICLLAWFYWCSFLLWCLAWRDYLLLVRSFDWLLVLFDHYYCYMFLVIWLRLLLLLPWFILLEPASWDFLLDPDSSVFLLDPDSSVAPRSPSSRDWQAFCETREKGRGKEGARGGQHEPGSVPRLWQVGC